MHAVRRAGVKLGDKVVIIGSGAIGMLVAAVCRRSGATDIAVADHHDGRLNLALKMGATAAINSKKVDFDRAVKEFTGGAGADKTFECVGVEATFNQAMTSLRKGGLATVIGIFEHPQITIDAARFITHEIRVQGAQGYCWDFPISIRVAQEIGLERIITHEFKLDELQKALLTCIDRESGAVKVVLHP